MRTRSSLTNLPLLDVMVAKRVTALGAGPMSLHSINAIIELANQYQKYVFMIPSRRQIDCELLGGGYVNNFSTEKFVEYVRARDLGGFVKLARDHSGPWQLNPTNASGKKMSHEEAIDEVKTSLEVDVSLGFDLIHIDPSPGLENGLDQDAVNLDVLELLGFCQSIDGGRVEYEIGADEQSSLPNPVATSEEDFLSMVQQIDGMGLRRPIFYVLQTGTKVKETRNVGSFDARLPVQNAIPAAAQVPRMVQMCNRNNVYLKEHNADYLSQTALEWHRRFGIHAANVAPEFGVVETRALLTIAESLNASWFIDSLSEVTISSEKWEKWLVKDSKASERDKVVIGGHYHFMNDVVRDSRERLMSEFRRKNGIDGEELVFEQVKDSIRRYLLAFGYGAT